MGLDWNRVTWPAADLPSFTDEEQKRWNKNLKALVERVHAKQGLGKTNSGRENRPFSELR